MVCALTFALALQAQTPPQDNSIHYTVNPQAVQDKPWRIGMNVASWTTWGAEQYMRNIIQNPGFEGLIDRWVVFSSGSDGTSFSDQPGWGMPDNYWNGASYEVRSGNTIGAKGTVTSYVLKGANGNPQFFTSGPIAPLGDKDMIVITKIVEQDPVPVWWIPADSASMLHVDKSTKRTGSRGTQSMRMEPKGATPARLFFYFDAISERAGKLLPVTGQWRLSLWAKAETPDSAIQLTFKRLNGEPAFIDQTFTPTNQWQEYVFNFSPTDNGSPQILQLTISATGTSKTWIDDVFLGQSQIGESAFRKEVIDSLKTLRPSFIRDSGALGDSFANRLSAISGRRAWVFHAGGAADTNFSYAIPDTLTLAKDVGANPWLIIPVTWSDTEYQQLGQYLTQAAQAYGFTDIIVEFGNENWNWMFRPLGIPYTDVHGVVAERAFQFMMQGAGPNSKIRRYLNGQHSNPWLTNEFMIRVPSAEVMSTAPYYFISANAGLSEPEALQMMLTTEDDFLKTNADNAKAAGKKIAIYEINSHTTTGDMPIADRNAYVAGLASGTALAQSLLKSMLLGYNPIMASNLTQFDINIGNNTFVKLWGMMRDIIPTKRLRPTGMAVMLMNYVISGKMYATELQSSDKTEEAKKITIGLFQYGTQWAGAATSSAATPQEIQIEFPNDNNALPPTVMYLSAASQKTTNEDGANVTVKSTKPIIDGRKLKFTIPAYGFVILTTGKPAP